MAPLAFVTYEEAGTFRGRLDFDPDWERYFSFEDSGIFPFLTARVDGELVGYVACLVLPYIQHRKEPCCSVNAIWLAKKHRAGTVGIRMLKRAVDDLQAKGVRLFRVAAKVEIFGKALERLGFEVEETVYVKLTGAK